MLRAGGLPMTPLELVAVWVACVVAAWVLMTQPPAPPSVVGRD